MAETDIWLKVGLDTKDASKNAEQLQKEVKSIFDSRQGESSAALTSIEIQMKKGYEAAEKLKKTIGELTQKQADIDVFKATKQSFEATKIKVDEILSKIEELKSKKINFLGDEMTSKEIDDYGKELSKTLEENKRAASQMMSDIRANEAKRLQAQELGDTGEAERLKAVNRDLSQDLQKLKIRQDEVIAASEEYNSAIGRASKELRKLTVEYDGQEMSLSQLNKALETTGLEYDTLGNKMRKLQEAAPNIDTSQYQQGIQEQLNQSTQALDHNNDRLAQQVIRYREVSDKLDEVNNKENDVAKNTDRIRALWSQVGATIKRINSSINALFKKLVQHLHQTEKGTNSTNLSMKKLLRTILKYGFGIRSLYVLFNKLRKAVKEGLANYAEYSKEYKESTESLKAATLTLKNSFATAFAPIIQFAIPYIKQLIQWMSTLLGYIAQFTSALTGQVKYTKAVEQTADALKSAGKAAEGYLSPIDTLNKMNKDSGSGVEGMFEEGVIDTKIAELAQRLKDTISELFAPLKNAWDIFGDYVVRAWKRVISSVKNLAGDIWRDFKDVWTGSIMQQVFYNITALLGQIGNLIAEIIDKIDEAWNANGKRILEAIASLLEVITRHFRRFVEITRDWVKNVDLNPLFEKFAELMEALKPVAEQVLGIFEDFYEKVLLKLAGWTLEEGLPNLLQTMKDFVEKIDWEKLRQNLSELWEHVEPFAERVGEGLILFLQDLSDKLADWVNSDSFEHLLESIENFLDGVSAEDIKNGIENVITFVATIKALTLLTGIGAAITKLGQLYTTMKQISLLTNLSKTVSVGVEADTAGAAAAGTSLATTFAVAVITAIAGFEIGKQLGAIIFPEDANYYKDFKWFGENGFFAAVRDWWNMIFLPGVKSWAEQLKTDFDSWTDDVLKIFEDFGDGFSSYISDSINVIINLLNFDFANAWDNAKKVASDAANTIINTFKNVSDAASSAATVGSSFSGIPKALRYVTGTVSIPRFATGGVIPPTADEHLVTVGDNNRETEVISPLSTIRQAVSEAISAMGSFNSQPVVIKQYLDGKQVAEAMVKEGKIQQMSTGKNMFALN